MNEQLLYLLPLPPPDRPRYAKIAIYALPLPRLPRKLPPSCANELILQLIDGGGAWWAMYCYWAKPLADFFYRAPFEFYTILASN